MRISERLHGPYLVLAACPARDAWKVLFLGYAFDYGPAAFGIKNRVFLMHKGDVLPPRPSSASRPIRSAVLIDVRTRPGMGLCRRAGGRTADPAVLAGLSHRCRSTAEFVRPRSSRWACPRIPRSSASAARARARRQAASALTAGRIHQLLERGARLRGRQGCRTAIAAPSAAGKRPAFPGCKADGNEERRNTIPGTLG